jgi:hypothetical protein
MNKPLSVSKVFVFEEEHNIVYIMDSKGETIGYIAMASKQDAEELGIAISKLYLDKIEKA